MKKASPASGIDPRRVDEAGLDADAQDTTRVGPAPSVAVDPGSITGRRARQGNTALLLERLSPQEGYTPPDPVDTDAPYGRFWGRRIIGSGARVGGGVYLGRKPREAIVVDVGSESLLRRAMAVWLDEICQAVARGLPDPRPERWVRAVRRHLEDNLPTLLERLVNQALPFDEGIVRNVAAEHGCRADELVSLDVYLRHGGGVCRHQVCFLGAVLELLALDGWLDNRIDVKWYQRLFGRSGAVTGRVTIERKYVPGSFSHAWVRWTRRDGVVFVLDAAQGVYARLDTMEEAAQSFYGPGTSTAPA